MSEDDRDIFQEMKEGLEEAIEHAEGREDLPEDRFFIGEGVKKAAKEAAERLDEENRNRSEENIEEWAEKLAAKFVGDS